MINQPATKQHLTIEYRQEPAEKPGEVYVIPVVSMNGQPIPGEPIRYGPMAKELIPAFKIQIEKTYRTTMRKELDRMRVAR